MKAMILANSLVNFCLHHVEQRVNDVYIVQRVNNT